MGAQLVEAAPLHRIHPALGFLSLYLLLQRG
jgi:hypothetical protein